MWKWGKSLAAQMQSQFTATSFQAKHSRDEGARGEEGRLV